MWGNLAFLPSLILVGCLYYMGDREFHEMGSFFAAIVYVSSMILLVVYPLLLAVGGV